MGKAVINTCYGGFRISEEAYNWLKEHGIDEHYIGCYPIFENKKCLYRYDGPRHHPLLIQCVEELGEKASDAFANLEVVEFEGDLYRIDEYDGYEAVETPDDLHWININD